MFRGKRHGKAISHVYWDDSLDPTRNSSSCHENTGEATSSVKHKHEQHVLSHSTSLMQIMIQCNIERIYSNCSLESL